jgi:octaprenyl-diphosphate synthase
LELSDTEFATYFRSKTLHYHTRIEHSISDVLARFSESKFYEPLNYAIQDGKRIRPLIVLLAHDAIAIHENVTDDPLPAAVAVELLHLESIIHDDIIDKETMRRDKAVFHTKYGLPASILSADFVLGVILEIASQYADSRIGRELSKAALRMSEGELEEVFVQAKQRIRLDAYLDIVTHKTATLFQASARIGAILSGAKIQTIESMSDFGLNLGIAYQLQDDLLDWNDEKGLARRAGSEQSSLQKLSYEYALSAKNSLVHISDSPAKERLSELAEFAVRRRF